MQIYKDNMKINYESKSNELDYIAWLNGVYVHESLLSTVGNMFNKGKPHLYPREPLNNAMKKKEKDDEAKKREDELLLQKNYMEMLEWTNYFKQRNKDKGSE